MKTVLVIGAGKFGVHLAINMCEMGNEVMLVDKDEKIINEFAHLVTSCEIGDYTLKSNLEALGVDDYDYIFVCVGDFQDSLVIVDYLKELGAKFVIGKASSEIHEKFLLKNGADKIVYPERDIAYNEAVEYSDDKIFDFIKITDDAGVYEIEVPDSWCSKTLANINVRRIHNITVLASRNENGNITLINSPEYVFSKAEHVLVMGDRKNIRKISKR